jgi:acyl dehydratase
MTHQPPSSPAVGDLLVNKTFPRITRTTLGLYAGASGDHNPIHIDIEFAKKAGFPDVFSQGMLVMGLLGQAVTDAVSPDRLRSLSTRFVAITQLGARITCQGAVVELLETNAEKRARLALTAKDESGDVKLSGEAVIAL